jgi:uncharacterized phiE125 gp8 family phage protein
MRELYVHTEATTEPVLLDEVRDFVGYRGTDADTQTMLEYLSVAARLKIEHFLGRNLAEKTMVLATDSVSMSVELPYGPIYQVSSVAIYDTYGVLDSTLTVDDDYYVLGDFDKWIRLESFFTGGYIKITYTAGYGSNTFALPKALRMALLRQIKYDFDQRGNPNAAAIAPEIETMLGGFRCSFL